MCIGVRGAHHLCSQNPGSAPLLGQGPAPKWPPGFQWLSPWSMGGGPSLSSRGPGCWQLCQAVPGMELLAFLVRRMASESYLLCLWHQLASCSHGGVRETRARGPKGSSRAASCSVALPPPIPSFLGMAVSEPELPSPDAQVSGWLLTPSPYRQKGHEPDSGPSHGQSMLCPPLQHRAGPVCLGSPCVTLTAPWLTVRRDSKCLAT